MHCLDVSDVQALGGRLVFKTLRSGPALLTEAGQAVMPYCQQLLEVASEACKAMQDFRVASTGVVSLGASQTVGTYLMPRLIAAFKKNNPEVRSSQQQWTRRHTHNVPDINFPLLPASQAVHQPVTHLASLSTKIGKADGLPTCIQISCSLD